MAIGSYSRSSKIDSTSINTYEISNECTVHGYASFCCRLSCQSLTDHQILLQELLFPRAHPRCILYHCPSPGPSQPVLFSCIKVDPRDFPSPLQISTGESKAWRKKKKKIEISQRVFYFHDWYQQTARHRTIQKLRRREPRSYAAPCLHRPRSL